MPSAHKGGQTYVSLRQRLNLLDHVTSVKRVKLFPSSMIHSLYSEKNAYFEAELSL